jgi:hypothetical protein
MITLLATAFSKPDVTVLSDTRIGVSRQLSTLLSKSDRQEITLNDR